MDLNNTNAIKKRLDTLANHLEALKNASGDDLRSLQQCLLQITDNQVLNQLRLQGSDDYDLLQTIAAGDLLEHGTQEMQAAIYSQESTNGLGNKSINNNNNNHSNWGAGPDASSLSGTCSHGFTIRPNQTASQLKEVAKFSGAVLGATALFMGIKNREKLAVDWQYVRAAAESGFFIRRHLQTPGWSWATEIFQVRAKQIPNSPWIYFEDSMYTYKQMNQMANQVAHWAHQQGIQPGQVVALMMENRPEFIQVWLGLAKVGVVTAFINYTLTGKALEHVLKIANASHFIVGSEHVAAFAEIYANQVAAEKVRIFRGAHGRGEENPQKMYQLLDTELEALPVTNPPLKWLGNRTMVEPMWYIYTSGTTGFPKAAKVNDRNVYARSSMVSYFAGITPKDKFYIMLPLYHSSGSVLSLASVRGGGSIVLRRKVSISEFWNDIRKYQATIFIYIGELCRYLLETPERADDSDNSLRVCIGNGLRADVWEKFQKRFKIDQIIEFYGSTEGNSLINLFNKAGSVGYIPWPFSLLIPNKIIRYDVENDCHIKDSNGFCVEAKPGEVGELISEMEAGDTPQSSAAGGTFIGYTDKKATEKKILHNVFKQGDAWFRTGDLLKKDEEGHFYFVDRIGDTFRWKGENVATTEVAEVMNVLPGIKESNVYGVTVQNHEGRCGMAAIALTDQKYAQDPEFFARLFAHLEKNLPPYARPYFIMILPQIEITSTFKHKKVELVNNGFNPAQPNKVYFRDDNAKKFVLMTQTLYDQIQSGQLRI